MKRRIEDNGAGSRPELPDAAASGGGGGASFVRFVQTAASVASAVSSAASLPTPTVARATQAHQAALDHHHHHHHHHPHVQHAGLLAGFSNKLEMPTGVHHSLSAFAANLSSANQQSSHGPVEAGRAIVGAMSLAPSGGMPASVSPAIAANAHVSLPQPQINTNAAHSAAANALQNAARQRGGMVQSPDGAASPRVSLPSTNATPPVGIVASTPAAATAAAAAVHSQVTTGQFQRLKVEDALSYLDQVKLRFGRQPQVYNDFLDIMKEFKSQSIDTPGVIARVSQLFRGHPELIVGFNTFLPSGYKIEVHNTDQVSVSIPGHHTTVVHTPMGAQPPQHHVTAPPTAAVAASLPMTIATPPIAPVPPASLQQHPPTSQPPTQAPVPKISTVGGPTPPPQVMHVSSTASPGRPPSQPTLPQHGPIVAPSPPMTSVQPPVCVGPVGPVASGGPSSLANLGPLPPQISAVANCLGSLGISGPPNMAREMAAQPGSGAPTVPHLHQPAAQPVEFNHAINYVNKIKLRFQGQPDIYKQFLDILHIYQKEQKHIKEGGVMPVRTLTEAEVYEKVAKLFENQEDLLQEFGQFLPDATNSTAAQAAVSDFMDQYRSHNTTKTLPNDHSMKKPVVLKAPTGSNNVLPSCMTNLGPNAGLQPVSADVPLPPPPPPVQNAAAAVPPIYGPNSSNSLKRPQVCMNQGPANATSASPSATHLQPSSAKKPKLSYIKDMSPAEAGKFATLAEYDFFDRVRKALRHEEPYSNFLRCITLYNEEIISRSELLQIIHPFLSKFPELLKWFKDFIGYRDGTAIAPTTTMDGIASKFSKSDRKSGDLAMEIDYATCKRLGASYCALPKTYSEAKCSGRTALCKEVLNDTWVSFPTSSEDSSFVTSRKSQYEEYIYRCEDERFELDVVLETNLATMRVLESVQKRIQRLPYEEAARFRLDDSLGGHSDTVSQRAIKRIYGDKAADIMDGLKKNPLVAVPLVLRRLRSKDEEWRDAQKGFNKTWRDQNERYYLKSLDHQGLTFKQNDIKAVRSKSLINEIETQYDERHERAEEGGEAFTVGPHMVLTFRDRKPPFEDVANLLIHHVKRQTAIQKEEKTKIKQIVRHFVPDLYFQPRMDLSDDENMDDNDNDDDSDTKSDAGTSSGKNSAKCELAVSSSAVTEIANPSNGTPLQGAAKRKTRSTKSVDAIESRESSVGDSAVTVNGDASDGENRLREAMKSPAAEKDVKLETEIKAAAISVATSQYTDDEYRMIMCNTSWYLFLRLHHLLCERLALMQDHAVRLVAVEMKDRKERKESTAVALRLKPKNDIAVEDYYPTLLDMVQNMLDGNLESTAFEDNLRDMFGINAYTAFTLDKVVNGAVRQLQHAVCDEVGAQCTTAFLQEARKGAAGGPIASAHNRLHHECAYQRKIEKLLREENCFKVFTYKREPRLTIELLDTDLDESEVASQPPNGPAEKDPPATTATTNAATPTVSQTPAAIDSSLAMALDAIQCPANLMRPMLPPAVLEVHKWSDYVETYVNTVCQLSPVIQSQLFKNQVFLTRNLRSYRKVSEKQMKLQVKKTLESRSEILDSEDASDSNINAATAPNIVCMSDNMQCNFSLANHKPIFVVESETYMFKKAALTRAKMSHKFISLRMHDRFSSWVNEWANVNVGETEECRARRWFMGVGDSLRPNKTQVRTFDRPMQPPYYPFDKYECDLSRSSTPSEPAASPAAPSNVGGNSNGSGASSDAANVS